MTNNLPAGLDEPTVVCRLLYPDFFKLDRSLDGVPGYM